MTVAAIVLIVGGAAYCWWRKGTDWPVALIFLAGGVALANTALGPLFTTLANALGNAGQAILNALLAG